MHVHLLVDMEGAAHITDHRECWPAFSHYWQTGRARLTADVAAVTDGLFAGGARTVTIQNSHGSSDWPNLLLDALPTRSRLYRGSSLDWTSMGFDAAFHVGFHARCGTPAGFMSHTHTRDFRLAVDDALITENHRCAFMAGVPVLGISGDVALATQLDGALTGTPFLAVKRSTSRTVTTSLYPDPSASRRVLSDFARQCVRAWRERAQPTLPDQYSVAVSMDPTWTEPVVAQHGFRRVSPAVVAMTAQDWRRDAEPAIRAAQAAANRGWDDLGFETLDLSSETAMAQQEPTTIERVRRFLDDWMQTEESSWRQ